MSVKHGKSYLIKFRYEETGIARYSGLTKDEAVKGLSEHLRSIGPEQLSYTFKDNNVVIQEVEEVTSE